MADHWLARPRTIRLLRRASITVLALTVAAELVFEHEPQFAIERAFGFNAWYGLLACAALILCSRGMGAFLKRPDDYYGERDGDG